MTPETRYKLTALGFFFVLFAAYFLQFVYPYYVSYEPADWSGHPKAPVLRNNLFVLPLAAAAGALLVYQLVLYRSVSGKIRLLPLLGSAVVLALLVYVHFVNQAQNLDYETWQKIMDHLGAFE